MSKTEPSNALLDTPLARLAARIATTPRALLAAPTALPEVRLHEAGTLALQHSSASLTLDNAFLRVDVRGAFDERRALFDGSNRMTSLRGSVGGGTRFHADRALRFGHIGTDVQVGFQALDWFLTPEFAPSLWWGWLRGIQAGSKLVPWYNLRIASEHSTKHLYLKHPEGYDYVLLRMAPHEDPANDARDILLVDTKGEGVPNHSTLTCDLRTLQFLYAQPLRLELLSGAAEDTTPLAFVGSCFGSYDLRPYEGVMWPIPNIHQCWASPAFARLAPRVRNGPSIVRLAMEYFLSSFRGLPDEVYLKLTVAIEGIALEVLSDLGASGPLSFADGKHWIVKDVQQWRSTLDALKQTSAYKEWERVAVEAADAHASIAPADQRASLRSALLPRDSSGQLPDGKRVRAAFEALGLSIDERMKQEIKRWHTARHTGVAERARTDSLSEQIDVLRSMLLALLMRFVGYRGPILGYERNLIGLVAASTSWSGDWAGFEDERAALSYYTIE